MTRALPALVLLLSLSGCPSVSGGPAVSDIVAACRTYETVAVVLKLGAALYPASSIAVTTVTKQVDPICAAVLSGQAAPAGVTAQWVSQQTVQLEEAR